MNDAQGDYIQKDSSQILEFILFPHFIKLLNVGLGATNFAADTKRKTKTFRKRSYDV